MKIITLLLAGGLLSSGLCLAQTSPANSTGTSSKSTGSKSGNNYSTTSGDISGSGATTAGSAPASIGSNGQANGRMQADKAAGSSRKSTKSTKVKTKM